MGKSIEMSAKTTGEATERALIELGASYDEVEVEVLSSGGLFKKAKVRVTIKETEKPIIKEFEKTVIKEVQTNFQTGKSDKPITKPAKPTKTVIEKIEKPQESKTVQPVTKDNAPNGKSIKFEKTLTFTKKLLELLENDATVTTEITERSFNINITGDNVGKIIGKGGEVLNALQTIVSSIAIANSAGENKRVYINVEDYKERRRETLVALAQKKADIVKKTGRYIKLEPMGARDRAIIHSALQDIEGIRTYSTGKDPHRCLCIAPKNSEK